MRRTQLLAAMAVVGLALLTPKLASADTLRVALSSPPGPFDPAIAPGAEQLAPILGAYEQLVAPDGGPEVAAGWSHDKSGQIWTFRIAPGHRFEDGASVDAAAVQFSLQRLLALGRGPSSGLADLVSRIDAPQPDTVRITLKTSSPLLLVLLADRSASIVNPAIKVHDKADDWGSGWLAGRTAGSGPYRLETGSQTGVYTLGRNPSYGGPQPYFSRLVFKVVADPTVRALSVSRGEVDVAFLMPSVTLKRLASDPAVRIASIPAYAFQNLAFNLQRPAVRDVRVRQAVAAAIDTRSIVRDIRGGRANVFQGPLAPGMLGADPALYPVRFDPAAALALAKSAGLQGGKRRLVMVYPGVSPETDTVAQYIQAVLAPLGLSVRLERLSIPAYLDRMGRGAYDLVLMGWVCNFSDPAGVLNYWFDPTKPGVDNPARYDNPAVSALIAQAAVELDASRRADLHRRIARLVNADLPYVYLQQTQVSNVLRRDIVGYHIDPVRSIELPLETMRRGR